MAQSKKEQYRLTSLEIKQYEQWKIARFVVGSSHYIHDFHGKHSITEIDGGPVYFNSYTFKCNSHVNCRAQVFSTIYYFYLTIVLIHSFLKVKCVWSIPKKIWNIWEKGSHGFEQSVMPRAIDPTLKSGIDVQLQNGATATQVLQKLNSGEVKTLLTRKMLNNRKNFLRQEKIKHFGFQHCDDIRQYALEKIVETVEQFEMIGKFAFIFVSNFQFINV